MTKTNTSKEHLKRAILVTFVIWDIDCISDNWEPEFMTIFVTWQLRVTLDSIRNSCDVLLTTSLISVGRIESCDIVAYDQKFCKTLLIIMGRVKIKRCCCRRSENKMTLLPTSFAKHCYLSTWAECKSYDIVTDDQKFCQKLIICRYLFLAVQNSSIGDIVPCLLGLLPLTIRVFTTLQSDPRDLRPLRYLIRVMRGHYRTKKRQWQRQ